MQKFQNLNVSRNTFLSTPLSGVNHIMIWIQDAMAPNSRAHSKMASAMTFWSSSGVGAPVMRHSLKRCKRALGNFLLICRLQAWKPKVKKNIKSINDNVIISDSFNIVCSLVAKCCQYSFAHGSYAQMKSRTKQIIPNLPLKRAQDKNLCHHDIIKHGRASCGECIRHDFSSQRIGPGHRTKQAALN